MHQPYLDPDSNKPEKKMKFVIQNEIPTLTSYWKLRIVNIF